VATLLIGLRDDSRVKMHFSKTRLTLDQALLAIAADNLAFLAWTKTKDAAKGKKFNRPSLFENLMQEEKKKDKDDLMMFDSPEEYDEYVRQKRGI
jgi:hypothetical protein